MLLVYCTNKLFLCSLLGYKLEFTDESATCIVTGDYNLKTQDCINYCYRKVLSNKSNAGSVSSNPFSSLFGSIFGPK